MKASLQTSDLDCTRPFDDALKGSGLFPLRASGVDIFQVNMGSLCNQACRHCHVSAGPDNARLMDHKTIDACLGVLEKHRFKAVDMTGGAPETNPHYRYFVERAKALGCHVKTRTNLTILAEKGFEDLPVFFASNKLEVIASLPYFSKETVDRQRGGGVFEASVKGLRKLNALGYGRPDSGLVLNLVYNPCGAFLPPSQKAVEADFRKELEGRYGIVFNSMFTITNMPVGRFLAFLRESGNLKRYMERLSALYNPVAASNAMCRNTVSVGYDGSLYDCDFNQMLGLKCGVSSHVSSFDIKILSEREIIIGRHCFGCTAGAGSSCTGAVA